MTATELVLILIAVIVVIMVIVLYFSLASGILKAVFGTRQDRKPYLRYFETDELGLKKEPVEFAAGKNMLRGGVYGDGDTTVVFCHGLGPGCASYTTEIAKLVSYGYRVLAVDFAGCGESDGDRPGGFHAGVECAVVSAEYALKRWPGKVILFGHSWGAYSVLCATKFVKVSGVVAISAFDSPTKELVTGASASAGRLMRSTSLFVRILNSVRGGKYANLRASKCIDKSGVPALLIHGGMDNTVPLKCSALSYARGEKVQKVLYEDKGHNPYNTVKAEKKLSNLQAGVSMYEDMDDLTRERFFSEVDYDAVCEEDEVVMDSCRGFIDSV